SILATLFPEEMKVAIGIFEAPILLPAVLLLIPLISVTVRRLHGIGRSGALALLQLIPFVGAVFSLILMFIPGQRAENVYGPAPIAA
ncbi:MAG: DUF805 domain-containing protein, partial [Pseudomonadota bacterium]